MKDKITKGEVQRLSPEVYYDCPIMGRDNLGDYVAYEDYEQLQERVEVLEKLGNIPINELIHYYLDDNGSALSTPVIEVLKALGNESK